MGGQHTELEWENSWIIERQSVLEHIWVGDHYDLFRMGVCPCNNNQTRKECLKREGFSREGSKIGSGRWAVTLLPVYTYILFTCKGDWPRAWKKIIIEKPLNRRALKVYKIIPKEMTSFVREVSSYSSLKWVQIAGRWKSRNRTRQNTIALTARNPFGI